MSWFTWTGSAGGGGGGGAWGTITGTLADQTDLQTALDAKVNDTGNESIAGIKTFSDTTDATSATAAGLLTSGGFGAAKKIWAGTGVNVTTGNVLITSGTLGRDTGVSGSLTDCPTNIYTNFGNFKAGVAFSANSASAGLFINTDSSTAISLRSGSTSYWIWSTSQTDVRVKMFFGAATNNFHDFMASTTTTTDATAASAWTWTVPADNWMGHITARVMCRRSDSGTEYGSFHYDFTVSREGGSATVRNTTAVRADYLGTLTTANVTMDASGADVRLRVQGEAAKTIRWFWEVYVTQGST